MHSMDGQFGDSVGGNGLKMYFNGEFAEEGKVCRFAYEHWLNY